VLQVLRLGHGQAWGGRGKQAGSTDVMTARGWLGRRRSSDMTDAGQCTYIQAGGFSDGCCQLRVFAAVVGTKRRSA
jgi:hypothetical protein